MVNAQYGPAERDLCRAFYMTYKPHCNLCKNTTIYEVKPHTMWIYDNIYIIRNNRCLCKKQETADNRRECAVAIWSREQKEGGEKWLIY